MINKFLIIAIVTIIDEPILNLNYSKDIHKINNTFLDKITENV
jgi:hypothetical protein